MPLDGAEQQRAQRPQVGDGSDGRRELPVLVHGARLLGRPALGDGPDDGHPCLPGALGGQRGGGAPARGGVRGGLVPAAGRRGGLGGGGFGGRGAEGCCGFGRAARLGADAGCGPVPAGGGHSVGVGYLPGGRRRPLLGALLGGGPRAGQRAGALLGLLHAGGGPAPAR